MTPAQIEACRKWVAALRSGKYRQARGYLCHKSELRYCCLGVACLISNLGKFETPPPRLSAAEYKVFVLDSKPEEKASGGLMPPDVQLYYGMNESTVQVLLPDPGSGNKARFPLREQLTPTGFMSSDLSMMNDEGYSFKQIADILEQCVNHEEKCNDEQRTDSSVS